MLLPLNEDQPQLIWMGSQQSAWDASHLPATGSVCIYSHHNPLSSQPGSNLTSTEAEGKWTSEWPCKVVRTTAATQFGPLQPPLSDLTATVRPAFPLSEQCQYASSCLSIFNYPVKLHYITCTKPTPSIARGCACSSQFNSTNLYQVPSIHSSLSACAECLLHLALGTQKWNAWPPWVEWGGRHCGMCCSTTGRRDGVNRTREFPNMTVSDIARGPSPIWEDAGRTNTWTLSSRSLESTQGISCSTD